MALDPKLLEIVACPKTRARSIYLESESTLYKPRLAALRDARDDIPVMLVDEATTVDDARARATARQGRGRRRPLQPSRSGRAVTDPLGLLRLREAVSTPPQHCRLRSAGLTVTRRAPRADDMAACGAGRRRTPLGRRPACRRGRPLMPVSLVDHQGLRATVVRGCHRPLVVAVSASGDCTRGGGLCGRAVVEAGAT